MAGTRAILVQILHALRRDPDILDIVAIMWNINVSGQLTATNSEVLSALRLLSTRTGRLFLLVDGLDECEDHATFLRQVRSVSDTTEHFSLAVFSRPTVPISEELQKEAIRLDLLPLMNQCSIQEYLWSRSDSLVPYGVASSSDEMEQTIQQIAKRANGMFLWAKLLVDYLQSPYLSVRQRRVAIRDLNLLEGLDSLYGEILKSMRCGYPQVTGGRSEDPVLRAFHFVLHAKRPLHVDELRYALAIPLNRGIDDEDFMPNFQASLSQLSGALIEVDAQFNVRFVHTSVIEYLSNLAGQSQHPQAIGSLISDETAAQESLAACCLSYLLYSVPPGPLSGQRQVKANREVSGKQRPFLEYASEFWTSHLLSLLGTLAETGAEKDNNLLLDLCASFLSTKQAVMTWIEACWMMNVRPGFYEDDQKRLHDLFVQVSEGPQDSRHRRDTLKRPVEALYALSRDLARLCATWEHLLSTSPQEIWEPSITAFTQSRFWETGPGLSVVAQFKPGEPSTAASPIRLICLRSQVSLDGRYLAIVRLGTTLKG